MASLVTRDQRGCLVPVEREEPPPEEAPLPAVATDAERDADEFLGSVAADKSGPVAKAVLGNLKRLIDAPGWNPSPAQKEDVLNVVLALAKFARSDRLQLQAARLFADFTKQDLDLARLQLAAQAQLDQQQRLGESPSVWQQFNVLGRGGPVGDEALVEELSRKSLAAFDKMWNEPEGAEYARPTREEEGGG